MSSSHSLIIFDISSFIFRAYYAIRPLHAPDGRPVNAVHGVLAMILKALDKYRPDAVFVAQDSIEKNFRYDIYPEYKANRDGPPDDLIPQFEIIQKLIDLLEIPALSAPGLEADDIIACVATQWASEFRDILIISSDKDLMQLVGDNVKMVDTMKDVVYDREAVKAKLGVYPEQVVDYLSLLGDTSDNIPGMKGIGAKGAAKLLEEYGSLDEAILNKDKFTSKKLLSAFRDHLNDALLSRDLIKVVKNFDLKINAKECHYKLVSSPELIQYLKELGLNSNLNKIEKMLAESEKKIEEATAEFSFELKSRKNGDKLIIPEEGEIGLSLIFSGNHDLDAELSSLAFFSLELGHWYETEDLCDLFKNLLSHKNLTLIVEFSKELYTYCIKENIEIISRCFDLTQAHFLLDPEKSHLLSSLSSFYLAKDLRQRGELEKVPGEILCERAFVLYELGKGAGPIRRELEQKDLSGIYDLIDGPTQKVLADLEYTGIFLDCNELSKLEKEFTQKLLLIESEIKAEVNKVLGKGAFEGKADGAALNLRSPKQVSELLFTNLELPIIKKTKTGASTDSEVLEELSLRSESPVPDLILRYRELDKLISTYVKALPELLNPVSKRLHTTFSQHVAATGRLSSVRPNLQNIPVKTESGRRIRKAFIAPPGTYLLGADYSQMELRLLAHFSDDPTMLKAFKNDLDIHAQTAAEVMGIPLKEVSREDRSRAKAVNFGLMYGQSSFGLSRVLKISQGEAKEYITKYFERFSRVKTFLDSLKEKCAEKGYAETAFGRKRPIPDIHAKNRNIKANAERVAVNSPIQGTAADIIKKAMIGIYGELKEKKLKSKMLLQVHDELIFEVFAEEVEIMKSLVKKNMESVFLMKIPLKVDLAVANNWFDLN